jgi:hypothetical protein
MYGVPTHSMGELFMAATPEEADDQLMAYAEFFCAATGADMDDMGERVQEIRVERYIAQIRRDIEAHERWWADVQRRRARYGYGAIGRVREWWGER